MLNFLECRAPAYHFFVLRVECPCNPHCSAVVVGAAAKFTAFTTTEVSERFTLVRQLIQFYSLGTLLLAGFKLRTC